MIAITLGDLTSMSHICLPLIYVIYTVLILLLYSLLYLIYLSSIYVLFYSEISFGFRKKKAAEKKTTAVEGLKAENEAALPSSGKVFMSFVCHSLTAVI